MSVIRLQGETEKSQGVYYEIDTSYNPLGVGGMGAVYRGVRVESSGLRRDVAVKFLYDDLPEKAIQRAKLEASIQIHNENLVEMFGFVEIPQLRPDGSMIKRYHVASELLTGVTLFDLLKGKTTDKEGNSIPYAIQLFGELQKNREQFARTVIRKVLSGVMALHDAGYIHRDIDPSNIMITGDGKIKLIDFGIAKRLEDSVYSGHQMTMMGTMLGKASYAAPELVDGDIIHENCTTDLYAIGILFFELVTGELPFSGSSSEVATMQKFTPMPLSKVTNNAIRAVIGKATQKARDERFQSAAEFRVALDNIGKSKKKAKEPITKPDRNPERTHEIKPSKTPRSAKASSLPGWASWTLFATAGLIIGVVLELILKL